MTVFDRHSYISQMYQLICARCFPRNLNLWLSKAIFNDIWVADLDIFYGDNRSSNIFNFLLCGQQKIPSDVKWFISFKIWINLIKKFECNKTYFKMFSIAAANDSREQCIGYCKSYSIWKSRRSTFWWFNRKDTSDLVIHAEFKIPKKQHGTKSGLKNANWIN